MSAAPSFVQGPSSLGQLASSEIVHQAGAEARVEGLPPKFLKEDIFRRNGGVGFEVENPIAFPVLEGKEAMIPRAMAFWRKTTVGRRFWSEGFFLLFPGCFLDPGIEKGDGSI